MTSSDDISANLTGDDQAPDQNDPNEMNTNQELVDSIEERIEQAMPTLQQLSQFEQMMMKAPDLAKAIAGICPELIMAFMQAAQEAQQGTAVSGANGQPGAQQQSGNVNPGMANGMQAPTLQGSPQSDNEMEDMQQAAAQPQPGIGGGGTPPQQPPQGGNGGVMMPGASPNGPQPQPAATTYGRPPPSTPGPHTPLRRQYFTGR